MTKGQHSRRGVLVLVVVLALAITLTPIVHAAVSGDFTSTYDATGDTDEPGREIQVSGTIEVTGEAAVEPRIEVSAGPDAVIATDSVEVFVEGEQGVNFDRSFDGGTVTLRTDEIPADTEIRVSFIVYPRGTGEQNITSGIVNVRYNLPDGDRQSKEFTANANLSNSPESRVTELQSENEALQSTIDDLNAELESNPDWRFRFFVLLGLIALVGVLVIAALYLRDDGGPPSPGSGGPPGGGPP